MVAGRRSFEGTLPVAELPRLVAALADSSGEVAFRLDFEPGALGGPQLHARLHAGLKLECQRSLELFVFPAQVDVRLGLLANEADVAALPGDCEPLLLEEGALSPRAVIEDELLLALPLVPVKPGSELLQGAWSSPVEGPLEAEPGEATTRPFADLRALLEARAKHH